MGIRVQPIHQLGKGIPDLLISNGSILALVELKNPEYSGKLTPDEKLFHDLWGDHIITATDAVEIVMVLDLMYKRLREPHG